MGEAQPLRPADPRQLGRYRLTGRLGSGGMGIVYAGQTEGADGRERPVAVKVIHPHLADAPEFRSRFRSEAALAARVARFCTAAVLDVDVDAEQPYLVTEFVDGPTLQQVVEEQGPLSGGALDALAIGIATALMAIHEAGVVHRDLKPGNVILSRFGPRVIDFGIARAADAVTGLTSGVIGSPPYMTPEQFRGEPATGATDVHAWGAVVTFAGTGEPPFGVGPPEVMLYRALQVEAKVDGLEAPLRALVEAALNKDVARRPTARELLETLAMGRTSGSSPAAALAAGVRISDPTAEHQTPTQAMSPAEALADAAATTTQMALDGPLTALNFEAPEETTAVIPQPRRPVEDAPAEPAPIVAEPPRRRRFLLLPAAAVVVLAIAASAAVWANHSRDKSPGPKPTNVAADPTVRQVDADDAAKGPAAAVPGAQKGGTATLYASSGLWNLDPAQNYYADAMMASSRLLSRTLTTYRENDAAHATLVGDLATDTGRTTDGGRTWEYTLRSGLKFEDGRVVTAADVAHGIARSFEYKFRGGPTYLQQWLTSAADPDFRQIYPGPTPAAPYPPGLTVPDDHTLRFAFAEPHPDLPSVLTLPNAAPVPSTGLQPSDDRPVVSTGPYRIVSKTDDKLVLTRNQYWLPGSDPVRTAYPDKYVVRFGAAKTATTDAFIADKEPTALQLGTIDPSRGTQIYDAQANDRMVEGPGQLHRDLCINTQRITDVTVRRALALAFDRDTALAALGGTSVGYLTKSLLSRRLPGGPAGTRVDGAGDPVAARRLLAGRPVTVVFGYKTGDEGSAFASAVSTAFERAGVTVKAEPIPSGEYEKTISTEGNAYDVYLCGNYGPDYLDGNALLPLRYRGATIRATGNTNQSYLDDPALDQQLDQLAALPDRKVASQKYAKLEKQIQDEYAPVIPFFDTRRKGLRGSRIQGVVFSLAWGVPDLSRLWVGA